MNMKKLVIPELGEIDFDSAEIMNSLELFFRVRDIPEKLRSQIIARMLESSELQTKRMHKVISACGGDIGKADLQFVPQLRICIRRGCTMQPDSISGRCGRGVMLWTGFTGKAGQI